MTDQPVAGSAEATWTKAQDAAGHTLGLRASTGDVYAVGPHTLVVGSTAKLAVTDALIEYGGGDWDACWTDPPWDDRIGKQFAKAAGQPYDDLGDVFGGLATILTRVAHLATVWTGWPAATLAQQTLDSAGFDHRVQIEVTYDGVQSMTPVQVAVRPDDDVALCSDLLAVTSRRMAGAQRGRVQIGEFLEATHTALGPVTLVDPFCGQEVAASVCGDRRVVALAGVELHPGRATRTLLAMSRATGVSPELVDRGVGVTR